MAMQVDNSSVCGTCKHKASDHVTWGGQPHYHGKEMRECAHLHTYCMVPECHCNGVVVSNLRQKTR